MTTIGCCLLQAQGRGRAKDSTYTVIEVKNSGVTAKEHVNEYRKDMMNKAIGKIQALDKKEYDDKVSSPFLSFWTKFHISVRLFSLLHFLLLIRS